eukprot:c4772_g1_i1.p1 GENE.c4772_g1_i1~~c4772_g1_i1.p1  ORF type:complete len:800 (+),score=151.76 c4772_g1_i1:284-2401(+)
MDEAEGDGKHSLSGVMQVCYDAVLHCQERSLKTSLSSGSCYNIYLWCGKKIPSAVRSHGVAKALELGTNLSRATSYSVHDCITGACRLRPMQQKRISSSITKKLKLVHLLSSVEKAKPASTANGGLQASKFRTLGFISPRGGAFSTSARSGTTVSEVSILSPPQPKRKSRTSVGKQDLVPITMIPKPLAPPPVRGNSSTTNGRSIAEKKSPKLQSAVPAKSPPVQSIVPPKTRVRPTPPSAPVKAAQPQSKGVHSWLKLQGPRTSSKPASVLAPIIEPSPKSPGIDLNLLNERSLTHEISERSFRDQNKKKLDESSQQCHEITPEMFLSGHLVAQNKDLLKQRGITHILNVAGGDCPNYHPNDFTYLTLFLNDNSQTDIECIFYDIINFLDQGTKNGHRTLVHCFQGVSRSATAVLCFLMFSKGWSFESALEYLQQRRSVVKPNAFFCSQLIAFEKRLKGGVTRPRIYEIAVIASHQPDVYAARAIRNPTLPIARGYESVSSVVLRADTCFVLQCPSGVVYTWKGKRATPKAIEAGKLHAQRLVRHEHAHKSVEIGQGSEKQDFWAQFDDQGKLYDAEDRTKTPLPPLYTERPSEDQVEEICEPRRSERPEMWSFLQKQSIEMFDQEDLLEEGAFLLFDRSQPSRPVFLWVGSESPLAQDRAESLQAKAQKFLKDIGLMRQATIQVIFEAEDDEPPEFDDYFKYD